MSSMKFYQLITVILSILAQTARQSLCAAQEDTTRRKNKVAIVGGGVSGTFSAKYLIDYDQSCFLESVVVFDPNPMGQVTALNEGAPPREIESQDYWQGGRVASIQLEDGTMIEIGASIAHSGFYFIKQMMESDGNLKEGPPFDTGKVDKQLKKGLGIYDGEGRFPVLTSNSPLFLTKLKFLFRYNADFLLLSQATSQAVASFALLHNMLEDPSDFYFDSPNAMWEAVGLNETVNTVYSDYLDSVGVAHEITGWRQYLPFQGALRNELVTAINLCNYNQGNSQLNALVGLGSFAASTGGVFSISGGNSQVVKSALQQAQKKQSSRCQGQGNVQHVQKRVTSVVSDGDTMHLYSEEEDLGTYDVVILAAPLQQSRISFFVRSHMDGAVLQPMPLNGMTHTDMQQENHWGHSAMPKPLPSIGTRPYTSVVTTIVSNVDLQALARYFGISMDALPRGIYMTEKGKAAANNITAVAQISSSGVYKVFSSQRLGGETLEALFGKNHNIQHIHQWSGQYGGATPDYRGGGKTMNYLLYDSGVGLEGLQGAALYYSNAIEASFACMELSAIGAKSVAKLVARRLGIISPDSRVTSDEL